MEESGKLPHADMAKLYAELQEERDAYAARNPWKHPEWPDVSDRGMNHFTPLEFKPRWFVDLGGGFSGVGDDSGWRRTGYAALIIGGIAAVILVIAYMLA